MFSKSFYLTVMEKHDKSALMKISQEFGNLKVVDSRRMFWQTIFSEWSNQVLDSP